MDGWKGGLRRLPLESIEQSLFARAFWATSYEAGKQAVEKVVGLFLGSSVLC